jgi:PAS domain S-box-containing protein
MTSDACPVHWAGRQAIVPLPEHIGLSNAGLIREELLSVINCGATTLIADMTATISCDHAGADAVARAFQRAVISGTELRLVVTAQIVRRVLGINGLDRLVSIYPTLEAATAARPPAPALALVTESAGAGTNGHAPPRRPAGPTVQFPPADGNRAAITAAVMWQLVDALQDGVALADSNGAIALANTRLEHMFGYQHAELLGQPVELLFPVDLEAAHGSHGARHAPAPRARPRGAGARLAGLRKDGTTFPAEISLSPVTTAAGQFTVSVIRDVTETRRAEELAGLAAAAVAAKQAHRGQELLDTAITSLFHVGLSLQAAIDLPAELIRQRITEALGHLDDTIREIRNTAFTIRDHDDPLSKNPSGHHKTATVAEGRNQQVSRPVVPN